MAASTKPSRCQASIEPIPAKRPVIPSEAKSRDPVERLVIWSRAGLTARRNRSAKDHRNCYASAVEKKAVKFRDFAEAEKADREFYRKLSGQERLNILLEMTKEATHRPIERVYRIVKFSELRADRETHKPRK
jgi:hypothetical protein